MYELDVKPAQHGRDIRALRRNYVDHPASWGYHDLLTQLTAAHSLFVGDLEWIAVPRTADGPRLEYDRTSARCSFAK